MAKRNKLGCAHPKVVRRSRSGLIDALMLRLGRYPWTCRMCGCRVYTKERGPAERKTASLGKQKSSAFTPSGAARDGASGGPLQEN